METWCTFQNKNCWKIEEIVIMKKLQPVFPVCPIHNRTATKMTILRKEVLALIGEILIEPGDQKRHKRIIHRHGKTITLLVREPIWSSAQHLRRIFEVTIKVVKSIRDDVGRLVTKIRVFKPEFPLPFNPEPASA